MPIHRITGTVGAPDPIELLIFEWQIVDVTLGQGHSVPETPVAHIFPCLLEELPADIEAGDMSLRPYGIGEGRYLESYATTCIQSTASRRGFYCPNDLSYQRLLKRIAEVQFCHIRIRIR